MHAKLELSLHDRIQNNSENNFRDTAQNLQKTTDGESYIGKVEVEHEKMFQMLLDRLQ